MKTKLNTTGTMSTKIEDGAIKLYSYNTVMGYVKDGKAVLVNGGYSMTTAKHLSKYRDMYSIERGQTYEYKAFIKRAKLDNVRVLGGWNE